MATLLRNSGFVKKSGDTLTGTLIVNDKVGIGTTNPTCDLEIVGTKGLAVCGPSTYLKSNRDSDNKFGTIMGIVAGDMNHQSYWGYSFDMNCGLLGDNVNATQARIPNTTSFTINSKVNASTINTLFTVRNSGNVGIGITNPTQKLHVSGALLLDTNPSNPGTTTTTSLWNQAGVGPTISGNNFSVQTNGTTEALRITTAGDVGIGTITPASKLSVNGTITSTQTGTLQNTSYSWANNLNTGIYQPQPNFIGFSAGSSNLMNISTSNIAFSSNLIFTNSNLQGLPTQSTIGGIGDKIILASSKTFNNLPDYPFSVGYQSSNIWYSTPSWGSNVWYVGGVPKMTLNNIGQLYVYDDIIAFSSASDVKLKTDIKPLDINCTDLMQKIRPVEFTWKNTSEVVERKRNTVEHGFIAQEVEELLPNLVSTGDLYKVLKYEKMVPYIVKTLQELIEENKLLKERISALENKFI